MTQARYAFVCGMALSPTFGPEVVAAGGQGAQSPPWNAYNTMEIYTVNTQTWRVIKPLGFVLIYPTSVQYGNTGKIIIL